MSTFRDFRPAPNQGARPDALGLSYGYVLFALQR